MLRTPLLPTSGDNIVGHPSSNSSRFLSLRVSEADDRPSFVHIPYRHLKAVKKSSSEKLRLSSNASFIDWHHAPTQ